MVTLLLTPLLFLFQLLVCESIFLMKTPQKPHFPYRVIAALTGYAVGAVALNYCFTLLPNTIPMRILFFLLFFSGSVPAIYFCFRMKLPQVLFVAIAGYSVQHIADSLVKILMQVTDVTLMPLAVQYGVLLVLPYVGVAALFYFLFVKGALLDDKLQYGDMRVLAVSALNIVLCLVLSVVMDDLSMNVYGIVIGKIYAILGCMLCLFFQVGLFQVGKMERTNAALQNMMEMERRQHQISKETIELINMKCHDLKHQLNKLESMSDEKRGKHIAQLAEAVVIYDSMIKTGNEALDMVVMEKKLLCDKHHIQFSFLGDASALSLMDEVDVYSLFGNMMDNAIESLQHEPDEERRVMTLTIRPRNRMLYISMDNYYSTPVVYEDGVIQTTKQHEPGMHGYGIRSIAYIVNAYKGDLVIHTDNNHFVLDMLLPMPQEEAHA